MSAQATLFGNSAQERFERFHRENPKVYRLLCSLARDAKKKGFTHYSMRTIWELLRWEADIHINQGESSFKLNDHYPPFYARLIMSREPDLAGFFELRGSRW
jgi:hypothetical protein